jgi:hypothetical protein
VVELRQALVLVLVGLLAAHVGLIDLDNAVRAAERGRI